MTARVEVGLGLLAVGFAARSLLRRIIRSRIPREVYLNAIISREENKISLAFAYDRGGFR